MAADSYAASSNRVIGSIDGAPYEDLETLCKDLKGCEGKLTYAKKTAKIKIIVK